MRSPDRIPDEVETAFGVLAEAVVGQHPNADLALLRRIFEIAEGCHHKELRKSGEPYVLHPLIVATHVATWGQPMPCVLAALLHDVPDTGCDLRSHHEVGSAVIDLVEAVCALDHGPDPAAMLATLDPRARRFAEQVLTIKVADRLHNTRTWQFVAPAKAHRSARQTLDVMAPIANLLGMAAIGTELRDIATALLASPGADVNTGSGQASAPDVQGTIARDRRTPVTAAFRHAIQLLPAKDRDRYSAEWGADLATLSGTRERLTFAIGLVYSAHSLRRLASRQPSRI